MNDNKQYSTFSHFPVRILFNFTSNDPDLDDIETVGLGEQEFEFWVYCRTADDARRIVRKMVEGNTNITIFTRENGENITRFCNDERNNLAHKGNLFSDKEIIHSEAHISTGKLVIVEPIEIGGVDKYKSKSTYPFTGKGSKKYPTPVSKHPYPPYTPKKPKTREEIEKENAAKSMGINF